MKHAKQEITNVYRPIEQQAMRGRCNGQMHGEIGGAINEPTIIKWPYMKEKGGSI